MGILKNYPSAADLDLDMWRATFLNHNGDREIHSVDDELVATVRRYEVGEQRDATARRIEMLGDLYDTLRELADRAQKAGVDVAQAQRVLQEMVAPKPFSAHDEDGEG
jgi:hypothetical protein